MSGGMGWGVGGQARFPVKPRSGAGDDVLERIAEDIDALREGHVLPFNHLPVQFTFTGANQSAFYDSQGQPISMVTVQVFTGTVDFYFGDYRGQPAGGTPHFRLGVVGLPVNIPLPKGDFKLTAIANGGAATGCLIPSSA